VNSQVQGESVLWHLRGSEIRGGRRCGGGRVGGPGDLAGRPVDDSVGAPAYTVVKIEGGESKIEF